MSRLAFFFPGSGSGNPERVCSTWKNTRIVRSEEAQKKVGSVSLRTMLKTTARQSV